MYYDQAGRPMDLMDWAKAFELDRRVAETTLADGKYVSTVWLGLDHSFGGPTPLIFETMVFAAGGDGQDLDCERYTTKEEAQAGHERMVAKWSGTGPADHAGGAAG